MAAKYQAALWCEIDICYGGGHAVENGFPRDLDSCGELVQQPFATSGTVRRNTPLLFVRCQDDSVSILTLDDIREIVSNPALTGTQVESLLETLAATDGQHAEDEELRAWASDALQGVALDDLTVADRVAEYCSHSTSAAALWACKLIGRLGDASARYELQLVSALQAHPDVVVRQQAASALGKQTSLKITTIAALEEAAESSDPRLSRLARRTIDRHKAA